MAGFAKTTQMMLGDATIMIGPVADLFDLNPTDHSIGLVKNFTITSEPAYTELTQGVKNTIVMSVMTSNPVRCTMEAYEYTAKNLSYALGLTGADGVTTMTVATAVNGAVTGGVGIDDITVDSGTGITAGDTIMVLIDNTDNFLIRTIESVATNVLTVVEDILDDIPDNSVVKKVNRIMIGAKDDQPFYAAKIAGKLADGTHVVLHIPKIRIVKGFNLAFTVGDFANLPIEFTVYDLVSTDTFYTKFNGANAELIKV